MSVPIEEKSATSVVEIMNEKEVSSNTRVGVRIVSVVTDIDRLVSSIFES